MNIKKSLLAASMALVCLGISAQDAAEEYEYTFQPHWYGQAQIGGQETLGEGAFGKLLSLNAQVGVGYQWNPIFGARLAVNGWRSRGTLKANDVRYKWSYHYVAPTVDLTMSLTNAIGGFNPNRKWDLGIFAGVGANIAFDNDKAAAASAAITANTGVSPALQYLWDGTHTRLLGQFGAFLDVAVSERVKLGLELQANTLNDHYNSKKAGNADWYFNALVGVKFAFGPTYSKKVKEVPVVVVEPIVEKVVEIVEKPVEVIKEVYIQPKTIARNIFFQINRYNITDEEMVKVKEVADFLKENPDAYVSLSGFADKGTGNVAINVRLSRQRAEAVANALMKDYGIAGHRIQWSSMGQDQYQPFKQSGEENLNRCVICVATDNPVKL